MPFAFNDVSSLVPKDQAGAARAMSELLEPTCTRKNFGHLSMRQWAFGRESFDLLARW